ncbi:MAG: hypothetical protein POH28_05280 [Acidocella sp.]|nr:hypothetical protein [Acidocella sp.]
MNDKPASRRIALKTGLGLLAATGAVALGSQARAQSAKADPSTVGYQTKPSNGQQCSGCVQFIAPNACKIVSGTIAPTGWCELYSPAS